MKYLNILMVLILCCSCSSINVNYDYERGTDFSSYTTYNYLEHMQTGIAELDEKRFFRAMDITLQSKGLKFSEEPDLIIDVKSVVYESQSGNSVGIGVGGGRGALGGGVSMGIPVGSPKLTREIEVNFIDAKKDVLIWQALSKAPFREGETPSAREKNMQELVVRIFEKYPPKTRK